MGRHRKPIEQHKRQGTYQPCRHQGPEPDPTKPVKPDDLTGAAGDMWDALAPVLESMGVYCEADSVALRLLCESYGLYIESCDKIRREGFLITLTDNKGNQRRVEHPAAKHRSRHFKETLDLMRQFGLTPSSRTGLNIRKPDDDGPSDLERILRDFNN
ncbi:phage terminase small subunit P27 family [Gimesia benthica]|uniref:Phage terminase small subunit P27 family n=1 Tax=Gimesia benthica TaxID=2608982 RepID=A0A6I6A483_9PLAN|nr:phage terminase small subunit P27 family [Gimesia benthica]QGQ21207.1 phage terminase small subunit P27 family [Gimesia benthica]